MPRKKATTLSDVAREVGVSTMTASVVLNGARSATRVSDATRARIQEVAQRLCYQPNIAARGLSRRRMETIGVASVIDGGELNLYFLEVLNGILEAAAQAEQNTTVFSVSDWVGDESKILQFCDGRVDGLIFIAPRFPQSVAKTLHRHSPFVTIHANEHLSHTYNLDVDNENGAFLAVRHLIEYGHTRIAHFSGGLELLGARQRCEGYRRALTEAGIAVDETLISHGTYSITSGKKQMAQLLQSSALPLPTAIFCGSDAIAKGCMEELDRHNISVPEQISLVGFDDALTASMTTPALTTVRQPFRQLGQRSVELLLSQIRGENSPGEVGEETNLVPEKNSVSIPHAEIFPVEMVVRKSVAPPANGLQRVTSGAAN